MKIKREAVKNIVKQVVKIVIQMVRGSIYLYVPALILYTILYFFTKEPYPSKIDPEYTNGILTASSILFVFWSTVLSKPTKSDESTWYRNIYFILSVLLLVCTVAFIAYSAVNDAYSIIALIWASVSFFTNIIFLGIAYLEALPGHILPKSN